MNFITFSRKMGTKGTEAAKVVAKEQRRLGKSRIGKTGCRNVWCRAIEDGFVPGFFPCPWESHSFVTVLFP
jgi:hypothetical protein